MVKKILILPILAVLLSAFVIHQPNGDEYRLKLAIIQRVIDGISWPGGSSVSNPDSSFKFGIYGDIQPFGTDLTELKKNGKIKKKNVEISFFDSNSDLKNMTADIIYVPKEYTSHISKIMTLIDRKPILIIGDDPTALDQGALVSIYIDKNRPKLDLNDEELSRRGFVVDDIIKTLSQK